MGASSSRDNELRYSSSVGRTAAPAAPAAPVNRFQAIRDQFTRVDDVQAALRNEGLESSNLIVAVDFTKSNEWTGKHSFHGKSLHAIGEMLNPYQMAIGIIAKTLAAFDDDNLIPCYGFGDVTTGDKAVFSFKPEDAPCYGLDDVQATYSALLPYVKLSGPTSFAPAIHQALKLVVDSGNQYHILLLVADGQVTRSSDMLPGRHSPQEQATINAIVEASNYPLSIIMVGVGDGPWDMMNEFDDQLPQRNFDNFQFVNFTHVMSRYWQDPPKLEAQFALNALMEIPQQYKAIQRLGLISRAMPLRHAHVPPKAPPMMTGPPPTFSQSPSFNHSSSFHSTASNPYGRPPVSPQAAHGYPGAGGYPPVAPWGNPANGGGYDNGYDRPSAGGRTSAATSASGAAVRAAEAMFMCPITQELMEDPVVAADGNTYERAAIEQWLRQHDTSPMTNARLPNKNLVPNHQLRSTIMEHKQSLQAQGGLPY